MKSFINEFLITRTWEPLPRVKRSLKLINAAGPPPTPMDGKWLQWTWFQYSMNKLCNNISLPFSSSSPVGQTHTYRIIIPRAATQSPIPFCGDEFNWYRTSVTRMLSQKPFTESEKGSRPEKQFGRTGPTLISRVSLCNYPIIGIWIFMYGDMAIWTHWSHLYIQWLDGNRNAEIMSPGQQNQQVNQTNCSWAIKHTNTDGLDGIEHTLSH